MHYSKGMFVALSIAAASSANAAGIGVRLGTTGIGGDVGFRLTDSLTARVGFAGLSVKRDFDEEDVRYEGEVKWRNISALIDWRFLGQLRLTGGIVNAKNTVDLVGTPTGGTFTINDRVYQANEIGSLNGNVRLGKSATPYLGIGYGDISRPGLSFYMDLGVMFQGSPNLNLNATCGAALSPTECNTLQADVAAEEREVNEDVKKFKYYPVFNLGLAYGF
jgi:hypothetical protein